MGRSSAAVAWVIAVAWFYLGFIFSRFSRFEGDWGNGRIGALIASHWSNPWQVPESGSILLKSVSDSPIPQSRRVYDR
jgi:hypothetical protein